MDAHETVLKAYKYFGEADMENLATLYHDDYVFYMNGMHRLSGQYHGFGDWASNCLAKIPQALPNFNLEVLTSFSDAVECLYTQGQRQMVWTPILDIMRLLKMERLKSFTFLMIPKSCSRHESSDLSQRA